MDKKEKIAKDYFADLVYLDAEGNTKEEIFMNIALFAEKKRLTHDKILIYRKILDYEKAKGTTAVGCGIACPEALLLYDLIRPFAFILCRTKNPIDFNAEDGVSVRFILASLSRTTKRISNLKQASYLTQFLKSEATREGFLKATTLKDVYNLFYELKAGKDGIKKD